MIDSLEHPQVSLSALHCLGLLAGAAAFPLESSDLSLAYANNRLEAVLKLFMLVVWLIKE